MIIKQINDDVIETCLHFHREQSTPLMYLLGRREWSDRHKLISLAKLERELRKVLAASDYEPGKKRLESAARWCKETLTKELQDV